MPLAPGRFAVASDGLVPGPGSVINAFLRDDGTWASPAGGSAVLDSDMTDVVISNSAAETEIYSGIIPAGALGTNNAVHLMLGGLCLNNSGVARSFTFRVKLNGTTIYDDTSAAFASNANNRPYMFSGVISGHGATNIQRFNGHLTLSPPAAATTGEGDMADNTNVPNHTMYGVGAADGTADITLSVTIQLSAAAATLTWTNNMATLRTEGLPASGVAVPSATETSVGGLEIATQAEAEAGTANDKIMTPLRMNNHPGVAKCLLKAGITGNTLFSWNITSIADTGAGIMTITIATDFSSTDWVALATISNIDATIDATTDVQIVMVANASQTATVAQLIVGNASAVAAQDPQFYYFAGFGDHA